jgi:hypothetical protein
MNPATKKQAEWLVICFVSWFTFMGVAALVILTLLSEYDSNAACRWTINLVGIPSWWLPMSFSKFYPCNFDLALVPVGLILHFLLWMAIWERREVWAWIKEKTKRR